MSCIQKSIKWILAILLAAVFVGAGTMKLTGQFNPDVHAMMVKNFSVFATKWPFIITGFSAETLRVLVGTAEVFFGALALCPLYTRLSSFIFICLMAGATYIHIALAEPFLPAAVLLGASSVLFLVSGDCVGTTCAPAVVSQKKKQ